MSTTGETPEMTSPGDDQPGDVEPGIAGDARGSGPQIGAESDILCRPELPSHQEAADTGPQVPSQGQKADEAGTEPDGSLPDQGGGQQATPGSPGLAHRVDPVEDGTRDTGPGRRVRARWEGRGRQEPATGRDPRGPRSSGYSLLIEKQSPGGSGQAAPGR